MNARTYILDFIMYVCTLAVMLVVGLQSREVARRQIELDAKVNTFIEDTRTMFLRQPLITPATNTVQNTEK